MLPSPSRLRKGDLEQIIEGLKLPLLVFQGRRVVYLNGAARGFQARLRTEHAVETSVLLLNHLDALGPLVAEKDGAASLLTAPNGETFAVHARALRSRGSRRVAVMVRELGVELEAICRRYRLSPREAEVIQLLIRGYSNRDIASTLSIAPATVKRHLGRIFDKTGVDSRTQLVCRLA
jgi:DNA-binding CsgD family transcriptional regulator